MSAVTSPAAMSAIPRPVRSPGYWSGVFRRFRKDKVAVGAGLVVLAIILMAVFADYIAPADPTRSSMLRRLRPIGTPGYPLGADELGRDMLSRLIHGARLSLFMGVVPVFIAFVFGSLIGVAAGFFGGRFNTITMRTVDVFYAFPSVLLAIALSGALGAGIFNSLLSLTIVFIPPIARIAESVTTQVRSMDYVEAARASGAGSGTIIRVHVRLMSQAPLYNCVTPPAARTLCSGLASKNS